MKTRYLNSKTQTEMIYLFLPYVSQSFPIHQAIWLGLLLVRRRELAASLATSVVIYNMRS